MAEEGIGGAHGGEQAIRVMLVEDDPDWRRGLAFYISEEPDMVVAGEAGDPETAIAVAAEKQPDVILMDIMLAGSAEGISLTAQLSRTLQARIIMLTSMEDKGLISEAFVSGAVNYLIKSDFAGIPAAIRQAAANRATIDGTAAAQMLEEFRRLKEVERNFEVQQFKDKVTRTELEMLTLIDQGLTQSQIAERSFISLRTVKNHVNNILRKLGCTSSKEAAQKAKEMGLL
ncbi:DNA-binding response regulator [Paenibacillaceae bacterium]|nr:DNA-binding response regulator [Paenibacillaceae bacterium]